MHCVVVKRSPTGMLCAVARLDHLLLRTVNVRMRILLVEDDESIREVFKLMLETESPFADLKVDAAANGQQAIDLTCKNRPDVVLLDLSMPGEHGFDVFKKLRSIENCSELPVIAVTAHNLKDLEAEAVSLGFFGYVTKPIDFDTALFPLLRKLAEKRPHAA